MTPRTATLVAAALLLGCESKGEKCPYGEVERRDSSSGYEFVTCGTDKTHRTISSVGGVPVSYSFVSQSDEVSFSSERAEFLACSGSAHIRATSEGLSAATGPCGGLNWQDALEQEPAFRKPEKKNMSVPVDSFSCQIIARMSAHRTNAGISISCSSGRIEIVSTR